jgi:surface protein
MPELFETTSFKYSFGECELLTMVPSMNSWDTSGVNDMSYMFYYSREFNQDISAWDTSSVNDMSHMFYVSREFNQDISAWDTSSVLDMRGMFFNADAFNQDISDWDTSSVLDMKSMFGRATAFNQDISDWDISGVIRMTDMLLDIALLTVYYDALLIAWEAQTVQNNVEFDGGNSKYSSGAAAEARARLISDHNWKITDGGKVP